MIVSRRKRAFFFLWIDRGIGKSSCALRFILLPSQMRRRSHAQVAGILAWCSRFSFHGFPIRRSLITSVPPDELKSLGSRRKRLRNAARGNPVASGFRGHLTGTMVGRYFLREQDRIFHVTSSRLLFSLSLSFFILFFFSIPLTALRPVFFYREFSTGWNESKNEKETFGLVFLFFFKKYSQANFLLLSRSLNKLNRRNEKMKREKIVKWCIVDIWLLNNILWINLD